MADHSDLIAKFQNLTGANTDVAKSFLESCAWNCDEAIGSYFEESNPMDDPAILDGDDELENMDIIEQPLSTKDKKTTKPTETNNRISTLSSLRKDEDENDSSEEEGQAFYAGGLHAGQQILGPKRDKNDIKSVFSKAKEHGAEVIDKSEYEKQKNHKGKQKAFQGQAYRLGDSAGPSEVVGAGGSGGGSSDTPSREIDTVLTFWSNGFTVNHGPLRDPADPDNALFLAQIKRGQVPKELVQEAKGSKVNLMMEDCSQQEYRPLKHKAALFGGAGHRLGSPATTIESDTPKIQTESNVDKEEVKKEEDTYTVAVDDTKPTTNIQIRLPDGSRHVLKLNHSHTVQDIRNFVINTRTDLASTPFILLSSFPRQQLSEDSKSITEANLFNALVIVKLS